MKAIFPNGLFIVCLISSLCSGSVQATILDQEQIFNLFHLALSREIPTSSQTGGLNDRYTCESPSPLGDSWIQSLGPFIGSGTSLGEAQINALLPCLKSACSGPVQSFYQEFLKENILRSEAILELAEELYYSEEKLSQLRTSLQSKEKIEQLIEQAENINCLDPYHLEIRSIVLNNCQLGMRCRQNIE